MMKPFWKSLPISINDLPSRRAVVRGLLERIRYGGAVCLTGDLRMSKTSLLKYLISHQGIKSFFMSSGEEIVFNYINCQVLPGDINSKDFWHLILQPLLSKLDIKLNDNNISSVWNPEKVMDRLNKHKEIRYVIVLDEFDVLLSHPVLGKETYILGMFRHIVNSYNNFSLIISSPFNLSELNGMIRFKESSGSPLFNLFLQITLRTLPEEDVLEALRYAAPPFTPKERQFIIDISAGHPFLLEIAASALWEQKSKGKNKYLLAIETVHRNAEPFFADKWHRWSEHQREVIAAIALLQSPSTLNNQAFNKTDLVSHLEVLRPEIFSFRYSGEIEEDSTIPGGYRICQDAMVWWVADEIFRTIREGGNFEEWLLGHKKSNTNTKSVLGQAVKASGRIFEKGATTLMEAYIKQLMNP